MKQKTKELIDALEKKYSELDQDKNNYLEGLLYSKTFKLLGLHSNGCFAQSTNPKNKFSRRDGFYCIPSNK